MSRSKAGIEVLISVLARKRTSSLERWNEACPEIVCLSHSA